MKLGRYVDRFEYMRARALSCLCTPNKYIVEAPVIYTEPFRSSTNMNIKAYISMFASKLKSTYVTCFPAWRDTLCGETNKGYFDFQQLENLYVQQISL
jgi:hypothetical protein